MEIAKPIIVHWVVNCRHAKINSKFEWLSAKISCEAYDDSSRVSFDVNLRMRKDSAIWWMFLPLNIKIARILITKDSVKFIQFQLELFLHNQNVFEAILFYSVR